ncbi:MAG: heavy metal translocating P-type ATPase [Phyllobacteriaceae bacterium]|nr:heavy metal translocating P-type ATPase [Phyllobacteriaceae bacterium]
MAKAALRYRAEGVRADTMLAQIIRLVERAQATKLPVQALVDRVTLWFVPAVMALAAITFAAWMVFAPADERLSLALVAAVSVLIIACPCAMGLATPTSVIVGTGRGAQAGILFRKGDALQSLQNVDVVAFDKTGTLTIGKPAVTEIVLAEGWARADVLGLAAGLEAHSEHPIAKAIRDTATADNIVAPMAERFRAHSGLGASAVVSGRKVLAGSLRFLAAQGVELASLDTEAQRMMAAGSTLVAIAVDGKAAALIAISDPIKPLAAKAIARLHGLGLKTVLISGDNAATAQLVGKRLGIDQVIGDVLPAGKVDAVKALKQGGKRVAFVGDGINDAPALAAADAGIAMGTGTDIAIEAAEIVLVSGDPMRVATPLPSAAPPMRNIRQNLFLGVRLVNVVLDDPWAAGALYPFTGWMLSPMLAASAMALQACLCWAMHCACVCGLRRLEPIYDGACRRFLPEPGAGGMRWHCRAAAGRGDMHGHGIERRSAHRRAA